MGTYIEKEDPVTKWMFWLLVVPVLIFAFVVLSQPAWRGEEMLAEMKANCNKIDGVMLETKQPLLGGSTWECVKK